MGMIRQNPPRQGRRYVLVVRPLEWYAGIVGSGVVVEEASESAVYVRFDGGLSESFPPARFAEYFRPEDSAVPLPIPRGREDSPSGSLKA